MLGFFLFSIFDSDNRKVTFYILSREDQILLNPFWEADFFYINNGFTLVFHRNQNFDRNRIQFEFRFPEQEPGETLIFIIRSISRDTGIMLSLLVYPGNLYPPQ